MRTFQIKKILVATSFSKRSDIAIKTAVDLAGRNNAELLLVHVVEFTNSNTILTQVDKDELKKQAREKLKEAVSQVSKIYGLKPGYRVYADSLYSGIYRANVYFGADILVIGHERDHSLETSLKDSFADRIAIYSKIPVLSVGNQAPDSVKVILFPFNEDTKTLEKLEQVKVFARLYDAVIHIAAFRNSDKALSKSNIFLRTKKVVENVLKEGIWCSTHLMLGEDYASEILQFATRLNPDMISVVVYPGNGLNRLFSSTKFKKLIVRSNISVLSIPITQGLKK